mmetsp:Transcript_128267/g.411012  ORF Transcript_128267/g.411012 Transcript_128267/m.411012 type:complete len:1032 (+) Transcript_128267:77-3172(+)
MANNGRYSNPQSPAQEGSWQAILDQVVPAVVALQVTAVRSFQDDCAGAHGGTGFVVDWDKGLMLTNRHVCTCGPERTTATFVGCPAMEEVSCSIAYVDPVHDFAILKFDPEQLRQTPKAEIALDPTGCRVGEEVRVVGNDSLEKLQILSGTVARIDRNPPDLAGDYHDENTFYVLASSGTRGGSSGSPVLNRQGRAIALNAAAMDGTMHAFYLPLHRVARVLEAVRAGKTRVPRGTLCAQLAYTSFPEVLRLGVAQSFIAKSVLGRELPQGGTFSKATPPGGMLQVRRCMKGTPASEALQVGDVLLELNGQPCVDFVLWDAELDASVGEKVNLAVCRGGERVEVQLTVQDQHDLIPHDFIDLAFGIFHNVPYQTAQKHHIPLKGIYVAHAGFVFGESVTSDAVILELNGTPCDDLHAFESALQQIPNKEYFSVGWMLPKSNMERNMCMSEVKMLRHWSTCRAWSLDPVCDTRSWTWRSLREGTKMEGVEEQGQEQHAEDADATPEQTPDSQASRPEVEASPKKKARKSKVEGALAAVEPSLCAVTFRTVQQFDMDLIVDSENQEGDMLFCRGAGVVLDADAGLILTDRTTVPQLLGDIEVMLGESCRSASVLFMHPIHSLVVLKVDPLPEGGSGLPFGRSATFEEETALEPGDECEIVGMDPRGKPFSQKLKVAEIRMGNFEARWPPRWHERNLEAIILAESPTHMTSGVLCDSQGRIQGLHALTTLAEENTVNRHGYGIPTAIMLPFVNQIRSMAVASASVPARPLAAKSLVVPSLEVIFKVAELPKLRRLPAKLRPSAQWLSKLSEIGNCVLCISAVTGGGPCDQVAAEGDLLVAVCGEVVSTARAVEARLLQAVAEARALSCQDNLDEALICEVQLTLLRRGKVRQVQVKVPMLPSDGTSRLLCWHGLLLRETPRAVREFGTVPSGVYICQTMLGSPGEANGIEGEFLVKVNGMPTPDLDAVLAVTKEVERDIKTTAGGRRAHVRVESADSKGRHFVRPLEPDPLFWPLVELSQDAHGAWSCDERPSC